MSDDKICEKTLLLANACDHCRTSRSLPQALIPWTEVEARFPARFDKRNGCDYCGGDTEEGEPLCLTTGDGWVHAKHCEDNPEPEELGFTR